MSPHLHRTNPFHCQALQAILRCKCAKSCLWLTKLHMYVQIIFRQDRG
ncbi:unnamed protein product [Staurois parvus]|uniref:Uncharacterized protein n=1 Tax=Staurois parvus TaxID=386267 RepID=A0ABN9D496_9NEOB|nr:unnamed protein product [Staurois parvus]